MLSRLHLFLILAFTWISAQTLYASNSLHFSGILRHASIHQDQIATLELIDKGNGESSNSWIAILTLHFGDLRSREYVSFHYDNVILQGSWLSLDQNNQEASVSFPEFSTEHLEGIFRTTFSTERSVLILDRSEKIAPKFPTIQPLWGQYESSCDGLQKKIQLFTYRSPEETNKAGHPFSDYIISGNLGVNNPTICLESSFCISNVFFSGTYNFYQKRLILHGRQEDLSCEITEQGFNCGHCEFVKTSSEEAWVPALKNVVAPGSSFEGTSPKSSVKTLEGVYQGYLYHELLGEFQAANADFFRIPAGDNNSSKIGLSSIVRLYFGGHNTQEVLTYRFEPLFLPQETEHFVLGKPQTETDAILEITSIEKDAISGVWYSLIFGRVGTFHFKKGASVELPKNSKIFSPLSGQYKSANLLLNVGVSAEKSSNVMENPFSPLNFVGRLFFLDNLLPKKEFREGSYDFYTGRIALFLEQKDRYLIGSRQNENSITLWNNFFNYMSPLQPFRGNLFEKQ